jgi:uncharacterized protein (DUF1810 family)
MNDSYDLQRFVKAQDRVFDQVRDELRAGRKQSHWIWFIFPQIRGLGSSSTSVFYAISSRAEAEAYLDHEVLGPRLRECTKLVLDVQARSGEQIFGHVDDLKFRSSMTLFAQVAADNQIFMDALNKYAVAEMDPATLERL